MTSWLSKLGPGFRGTFRDDDLTGLSARGRNNFFSEKRIGLDTSCRHCDEWSSDCGLVPDYDAVSQSIGNETLVPCHCNQAMLEGPVHLPFSKLISYRFDRDRWLASLRRKNDLTEDLRELSPNLFFLGIAQNAPDAAVSVFLTRLPLQESLTILDGRFDGRRLFIALQGNRQENDAGRQALLLPISLSLTEDLSILWKRISPSFTDIGKIIVPQHAAYVFTNEWPNGRKVDQNTLDRLRDMNWPLFVDLAERKTASTVADNAASITKTQGKVLSDLMRSPKQEIRISYKIASDSTIRKALQLVDPQKSKGRTRRRWFHAIIGTESAYRFSPGEDSYCLILPL